WWYPSEGAAARRALFEGLFENRGFTLLPPEKIDALRRPSPLPKVEILPEPEPEGQTGAIDSTLGSNPSGTTGTAHPAGGREAVELSLWKGLWTGKFLLGGLPVSDKWTDRLPSTFLAAVQARHHFLGPLNTEFRAEILSEKESANVLVNTSLKGETQVARSDRLVSLIGASLQLPQACKSYQCRWGTAVGWGHIKTRWSYDRELTTLAVWAPSGEGIFVEPELELTALRPQLDGIKGRIALRHQRLDDGDSTLLAMETGWQFRSEWMSADWGGVNLSGLSTSVGFKIGRLKKTKNIRIDATGTTEPLSAVWLSLSADLEEAE
ncbi:MAG: hypothetical protein RIR26_1181, partial [Pseudomonadota bacterium]